MERNEKVSTILRQFKKKSKRIVNKDFFTEFFYLNKNRKVVEFLTNENVLIVDEYVKKFLPNDFREFVEVEILNEEEEPVQVWYYDEENLVIVIKVNWGFKKQEISVDIDMENFYITVIDKEDVVLKEVDYVLLNDFIISFLTNQAKNLAQTYEKLTDKKINKTV